MLYFGNASSGYGYVERPATDPTGKYLYACGAQSTNDSCEVHGYFVDANNGSLTEMTGSPLPFGAAQSSTGEYLYGGSEIDETEGEVLGLGINSGTGALTQLPGSPYLGSSQLGTPIVWSDWETRYLWAYSSRGIETFTINSSTGALTASGSFLSLPSDGFFDLAEDHTVAYVFTGSVPTGTGTPPPDLTSWSILSDETLKEINSMSVLSNQVIAIAVATKNPR